MAKLKLTLTQRKILKRSEEAVAHYKSLDDNKRGYEQEDWHCVNVKRYSEDAYDIKKIAQTYPEKYRKAIITQFSDDAERLDVIYHDWLGQMWEQLNYDLLDIENITKGAKDEHKEFKYLRTNYNWIEHSHAVLSLGRMGGWACFQDNHESLVEELDEFIEEAKLLLSHTHDFRKYNGREHYREGKEALEEQMDYLEENTPELMMCIQEIAYIKNYIEKFNKDQNYSEEIKFRVEEFVNSELK